VDRESTLAKIVAWATTDDNVRAVVLTGAAALGLENVDELSDLDVEFFVNDPPALLDDSSWYKQFGEVLVVEALPNPEWHPTRLVCYVGGKIDFMVAPKDALHKSVYARPYRVLLDKDQATANLTSVPLANNRPPGSAEFLTCINWFYSGALMCAKCIVRSEPWLAKNRDWDMKRQLRTMLEWDHKSRYGWAYDTWFNGKRLDQWIDADLRDALDQCWANFSSTETTDALWASIELFDKVSLRTASALGLTPFDSTPVRDEVERILGMRDR
jgi:aminoglycoside 6-adenylyltransferase